MHRFQNSEIRYQKRRWILEKAPKSPCGITLIALIITIIVMLILVAVTVSMVVNSGLFGHASNAAKSWNSAQEQEEKLANGELNFTVGDKTYNSIDSYLAENPSSVLDPELNRKNIKVGDYVDYTPDTAADYSLAGSVSGYYTDETTKTTVDQTIPQENLTWRIMNINSDGTVELISSTPTTATVGFGGSLGYNNGVLVLNDICKKQYSNTSLNVTARSLNLVDIEKKLNSTGITTRAAYKSLANIQYGSTNTYGAGVSNAPDIFDHTGIVAEEESKNYYTTPTSATHSDKGSLTVTQTYYYINPTDCANSFDDKTFREMAFGSGKYVWLASRSVDSVGNGYVHFGLRDVHSDGSLAGRRLFLSNGGTLNPSYSVRPVVMLGSNVKISTTGGTESNPRTLSL